MQLKNTWVGYLTRSYEQIKASLLSRLTIQAPEITDHSSSNLLVIIIEMFSGIAEMLNLYIDNMAREAFIMTARRYSSMVKLVKLLDYRIKAATPASTELKLTFDVPATGAYVIPLGNVFATANGIEFSSTASVVVFPGDTYAIVPVKQWVKTSAAILGVTTGSSGQALALPAGYVHDSLSATINAESWIRTDSLAYSKPNDRHFLVDIDVDGIAYMIFGDGTNGKLPAPGYDIIVDYYTTDGDVGNIDNDLIVTIIDALSIPGVNIITCTNPAAATSGSGYETIEQLRKNAPLSIRTLMRAVTRQDYIDIAKLCPGVSKAGLYFECGKYVDIYVTPLGGGIASPVLLQDVENWFEDKRMVTTFVRAIAAGQTRVKIKMNVQARFREDPLAVKTDVENALVEWGTEDNQEINRNIRVSDIIALVDNLRRVDYLNLSEISTIPYAKPIDHTVALNWLRSTNLGSTERVRWKAEYMLAGNYFRLFKGNIFMGNVNVGVAYTDPSNILTITFQGGVYSNGQEWEWVTYPFNQDVVLDDFTIPYVSLGDLDIIVTPTYTAPI